MDLASWTHPTAPFLQVNGSWSVRGVGGRGPTAHTLLTIRGRRVLRLPWSMLEEHPGGFDVIMGLRGRDATQEFEDAGHSESARQWALEYTSGEVLPESCTGRRPAQEASGVGAFGAQAGSLEREAWLPLLLGLASLVSAVVALRLRDSVHTAAR
ncbi:unnamed protein product [Prorocentrum cordatum]|uniref:Cytochrome b5 heme-binding domain-containing protein n=1 Tax=Prorocentrum cordatum TaxID=2364126 RepID=A0ABN9W8N0_9DINO|nr:unnamed protein product [Polarella glacialis]